MFIPTKEQAETVRAEFGVPTYVTDAAELRANARAMLDAFSGLNTKIFYAMKANFNPHIVRVLKDSGIYGIDAVSVNEVQFALSLGYKPEEIIFTPSNPSTEEIQAVGELGVLQNLGSLSELRRYCELFPDTEVSVRLSLGIGAGEFDQISTGGNETKFGIVEDDIDEAFSICKEAGVTISGLHSHLGSGFYEPHVFQHYVEILLSIVRKYESVTTLDLGGGFGVKYKPEEEQIDLEAFAAVIKEPVAKFETETGRTLELRIEPGKYLVSDSTVLLAEVTTVKEKGENTFVGLNSGFHHLIRPAMYGAYQHVVNCSRTEGEKKNVQVVGNVCETCDVFNEGIELIDPQEGDLLAILVAGGYGASMSSNYNMQGTAAEVMIDGEEMKLTRKRQDLEDVTRMFE